MNDLRPQGFLGGVEPLRNADLDLPRDIQQWSPEHFLKYVTRRGENASAEIYPQLAQASMEGDQAGSSAGGEQPKFTSIAGRGDDKETIEHVIVKFSPPVGSESGRRWADLLICEHLALEVIAANGIAASRTSILEFGDRVFLFGALIGNEDKHHGNIAVSWTFDEQYRLLPSYDMLPMLYRPNTHGEIVQRNWNIASAQKLQLMHLPLCFGMAQAFWNLVLLDQRISAGFKELAARHIEAIELLNPRL